jgi:hypothetical protein
MNPYNNYYAADLKEFITLNKLAKQDFHPDTHFDLLPGNADAFAAEIEKYASNLVTDFCSTSPPHVKLMQLMAISLLISTQITC